MHTILIIKVIDTHSPMEYVLKNGLTIQECIAALQQHDPNLYTKLHYAMSLIISTRPDGSLDIGRVENWQSGLDQYNEHFKNEYELKLQSLTQELSNVRDELDNALLELNTLKTDKYDKAHDVVENNVKV